MGQVRGRIRLEGIWMICWDRVLVLKDGIVVCYETVSRVCVYKRTNGRGILGW